jgi:hypothetical protein
MTTYTWPAGQMFIPSAVTLRQIHNNQASVSPQSGFTQTNSLPGARWGWAIDFQPHLKDDRQALEAFLTRLSGMEHRLQIWDMRRPYPLGTLNRTGVTHSAASALANTITLNGCGASTTIRAGDWIGLSTGQLVMAAVDGTANGSGVVSIEIRHPIRTALSGGGAVTLNKPTAKYILTTSTLDFPRQSGASDPPLSAEFVEVFL